MSKPFLSSPPVLAIREDTLDGQAIRVREASMLERAEYQRLLREKGMVEAVAYYIERRILLPSGEQVYTAAEALQVAQLPADRAGDVNAVLDVLAVKKTDAPTFGELSPPMHGSSIDSPSH